MMANKTQSVNDVINPIIDLTERDARVPERRR